MSTRSKAYPDAGSETDIDASSEAGLKAVSTRIRPKPVSKAMLTRTKPKILPSFRSRIRSASKSTAASPNAAS